MDTTHPEAISRYQVRVTPRECASPHSTLNKALRAVWGLCWVFLFRPSPPFLYTWRRGLLRLFGARVGRGAKVMPSTKIWAPWKLDLGEYACLSHGVDCYCVDNVSVGPHATVSQYSFLCTATHDDSDPHMALVTAPIRIDEGAWVCADVFVGPGVTVAEGAVVGARSMVLKNVPAWTVCGGSPFRVLRERKLRGPTASHNQP